MVVSGYGLYNIVLALFVNNTSGSFLLFETMSLYLIFGLLIVSFLVDIYALFFAALNFSMYVTGTEQYQFIVYNAITDYLNLDGGFESGEIDW